MTLGSKDIAGLTGAAESLLLTFVDLLRRVCREPRNIVDPFSLMADSISDNLLFMCHASETMPTSVSCFNNLKSCFIGQVLQFYVLC